MVKSSFDTWKRLAENGLHHASHYLLRRCVGFLLMLCGVTGVMAQQPGTFLYRIQGNGLARPSYLMGTIHLNDSRLFDFSDSMYRALEKADVFAMEVHPDSLIGKVMDKYLNESNAPKLGSQLSASEMKALKKAYQRYFDKPMEEMTLAELVHEREELMKPDAKPGDMELFMDMYLMQLSRRQGKKIAGLEKADEQLNLLDSMLKGNDPQAIMKGLKKDRKAMEGLVNTYLAADMAGIATYVKTLPAEIEDVILLKRNKVMLQSMMHLMQNQSAFVAVGAAHLPGNQGLLEMLQRAGYEVVPVIGANKLHASKYEKTFTPVVHNWYKLVASNEGFEVDMPVKPTENLLEGAGMKMYTAMDWVANAVYFATSVGMQVDADDENADSLLKKMGESMLENFAAKQKLSYKFTTVAGLRAIELSAEAEEKEMYKAWAMLHANKIYLLMVAANGKGSLDTSSLRRFKQSFSVRALSKKEWKPFTDTAELFTLSAPVDFVKNTSESAASSVVDMSYYGKDANTGVEYIVTLSKCLAGYQFSNDSTVAQLLINNFQERLELKDLEVIPTNWLGYPSLEIAGRHASGPRMFMRTLQRGNRFFAVSIFGSKSQVDSLYASLYFDEFQLLPYNDKQLDMQKLGPYSIPVSGDSARFIQNENGVTDSSQIAVYFPEIAATLNISVTDINPYTWAVSDSAYLEHWLKVLSGVAGRSILSTRHSEHHGYASFDIMMQQEGSHQIGHVRLVKSGDKLYDFTIIADPAAGELKGYQQGLMRIGIPEPARKLDLNTRSAKQFFVALDTASPASFKTMVDVMDDLPFAKQDLPLLLAQAVKPMIADTLQAYGLEEKIWDAITGLADSSDVPSIVEAYHKADTASDAALQSALLLAKLGTPDSYRQLCKLLPLPYSPHKNVDAIFNAMDEYPALAKGCIAGWYPLLSHAVYGTGILKLHRQLRDSGWATEPVDFRNQVLKLAEEVYQFTKAARNEYIPFISDLVAELAQWNTPEAFAALNKLALGMPEYEYYRFKAIRALVENGQKPESAIHSLAAIAYWRVPLFDVLTSQKQTALFPSKYRSQAALAESYLLQSDDAEGVDTVVAAGDIDMAFKGSKSKFYLFKVGYKTDEGYEYYWGIAGPFGLNSKEITIAEDVENISGISKETYNKSKAREVLTQWIRQWEEASISEETE